ncbi:MAG TPA: HD domain-containing protein [Nitrososphaera sp.]|nr:HD domain-containing protein [Nitrososphaera sp.]
MVGDLSSFFHFVLQLKSVKRAGWVSKVAIKDAESVADHTFSMCAMVMLLSDLLGLDTQRAMKMAILHDLAESIVGDYMPGDVTSKQKVAKEKKAMKSILSNLPSKIRLQYEQIWLEYLQNKTSLANILHRIDKLEMALQANQYAKQGYAGKLLAPFFQSAKKAVGDEGDIVSEILNSLRPTSARK